MCTASWWKTETKLCPFTSMIWSPTCNPASSAGEPLSTLLLSKKVILTFLNSNLNNYYNFTLKYRFPDHTLVLPSHWTRDPSFSGHEEQPCDVDSMSIAFHLTPLPSVMERIQQFIKAWPVLLSFPLTFCRIGESGVLSVSSTGLPEESTL